MLKRWNRTETWFTLIVLAVGALIVVVLALFAYISATATPLHPDPRAVSSVTEPVSLRQWTEAVQQGRQNVRANLIEQDLPGLSVAVGAGGAIVCAEGFGWADIEQRRPVAPETRFRIGTASTALTSAAVGLLLEKGRLKLDDWILVSAAVEAAAHERFLRFMRKQIFESLGGMVASLMTCREHGIVVSVASNISYADTFTVGLRIAQAFAEQARRPARK